MIETLRLVFLEQVYEPMTVCAGGGHIPLQVLEIIGPRLADDSILAPLSDVNFICLGQVCHSDLQPACENLKAPYFNMYLSQKSIPCARRVHR